MRVAHVMAGARHGGAELFFERLCPALARAGETVLPVIRRDAGRAARLRAAGLAPVQLGFGGALDVATGWRLRAVLRRFRPQVTMAWMNRAARFTPSGLGTRSGLSVPVLVGRLGGYYDLAYYRRCDHLVGNTRGIVDWIVAQGIEPSRVHHLPNFCPDLRGAAPERLGVPAGARLVLAAGRLHPVKGFDVLVRAMPLLPDVHVLIAGEGAERATLAALAGELGVADRLHLPGWRGDTAALLAAADVLACPSRSEPLGNVVLEAFSAGCPVVASRAAGPVELIEPGETGLLVPIEDAPALAAAIASLLGDTGLAAALAAAGRSRFEAEHAEPAVVQLWQAFFGAVAPNGAPGAASPSRARGAA